MTATCKHCGKVYSFHRLGVCYACMTSNGYIYKDIHQTQFPPPQRGSQLKIPGM